jgi:hypothetical protein
VVERWWHAFEVPPYAGSGRKVQSVVLGDYRDLFVVIATSAATLIGLLFVAM